MKISINISQKPEVMSCLFCLATVQNPKILNSKLFKHTLDKQETESLMYLLA